jgi:hypothetical protein
VAKAKKAARRTRQLDPNLPEAHAVLGAVRFWNEFDRVRSERHFEAALALGPLVRVDLDGAQKILQGALGVLHLIPRPVMAPAQERLIRLDVLRLPSRLRPALRRANAGWIDAAIRSAIVSCSFSRFPCRSSNLSAHRDLPFVTRSSRAVARTIPEDFCSRPSTSASTCSVRPASSGSTDA